MRYLSKCPLNVWNPLNASYTVCKLNLFAYINKCIKRGTHQEPHTLLVDPKHFLTYCRPELLETIRELLESGLFKYL